MDRTIQSLLGIADDEKRIYRFQDGEVQREEYQYCQLLDQLVFGDKGYVDTLGQTWDMIHDPRFMKIESTFIVNRKAVFGGDARTGKQYMSSEGMFVSTIADLEEYSEVLGEGRYFWLILTHPEERCPMRLWYERIYPGMIAAKGAKVPTPGDDLRCVCGVAVKAGVVKVSDPRDLKDAPDDLLWALLKQECPNYFTKDGTPNGIAKRMFDLFRADLLGLIADYSPTPLVDAFIELDTGDVAAAHDTEEDGKFSLNTEDPLDPPVEDQPAQVFLEVDILEKALTYRATMRATAAKILRSLGIQSQLKTIAGGDPRLTDFERDTLLRMVYEPTYLATGGPDDEFEKVEWPDNKAALVVKLLSFVSGVTMTPYEERLKAQLATASQNSLEDCHDLLTGKLEPINSYTEPKVEVQLDPHAAVMEAILRNPLKQELFIIWAEAEERSTKSPDEEDRINMSKLYSILTPVFSNPELQVGDEEFTAYLRQAGELGFFPIALAPAPIKGHRVPDEDAFLRNRALREKHGEKRQPMHSEPHEDVEAFHRQALAHTASCELHEHYLHHITRDGYEFDCLHECSCKKEKSKEGTAVPVQEP
jgi:hypothetical protein